MGDKAAARKGCRELRDLDRRLERLALGLLNHLAMERQLRVLSGRASEPGVLAEIEQVWQGFVPAPRKKEGKVSDKINIKKTLDPKQCAAMRCKSTPVSFVSGDAWQLPDGARVPLCDVHMGRSTLVVHGTEVLSAAGALEKRPAPDAAGRAAETLARELNEELSESIELAKTFEVKTQADLDFVAELLIDVKRKLNQLAEAEASVTKPIRELLEGARELFRPAKNKLTLFEAMLKGKIAHARAVEDANNRKALADVEAAHTSGNEQAVEAALAQIRHQSNVDGVSTRVGWTWQLEDISKVPLEYLEVDTLKLNALCRKAAEPDPIPGIRFVSKNIVTVRSKEAQA